MLTTAFAQHLDELVRLARERRCVLLCAEAVPWKCHRSLLADALVVRGIEVLHILSPTRAERHRLTPFARVEQGQLLYPGL